MCTRHAGSHHVRLRASTSKLPNGGRCALWDAGAGFGFSGVGCHSDSEVESDSAATGLVVLVATCRSSCSPCRFAPLSRRPAIGHHCNSSRWRTVRNDGGHLTLTIFRSNQRQNILKRLGSHVATTSALQVFTIGMYIGRFCLSHLTKPRPAVAPHVLLMRKCALADQGGADLQVATTPWTPCSIAPPVFHATRPRDCPHGSEPVNWR